LVEGIYSFGLTVTDNGGSTSAIDEVIVIVNKAPSLNLALNKPVTASSLEYGALTAANAIDGSITSRWSSQFTDTQWILVDLGASYSINQIKLFWEAAFARDFQIQISSDAVSWSILNSISNNTTLTNDIILDGTGQYIRIYCTKRATSYGYSIYELEVFGEPSTTRNSSARIAEYIPSDLKETSLGISIYPIPFNNHLTIEGAPTGSSYVIRSTSGDTVITGAVIKESIDTTQLSQGVYIIDVISNNIITRNKLIK
jgi:PKD repeat protein